MKQQGRIRPIRVTYENFYMEGKIERLHAGYHNYESRKQLKMTLKNIVDKWLPTFYANIEKMEKEENDDLRRM